ncbi:hypothetical protein NMG60_11015731 [Bertholletia excelsa]
MASEPVSNLQFPPGFRFQPTDEELIIHYLLNKVNSCPLPAAVIAEIELYNYNPWELPKKALFGEDEWYFFSPRDRKYPNGERPNRTAASGYWKATGTDKPIFTSHSRKIGAKKSLVFYSGRPPNGVKTNWTMNEYRLPGTSRPLKLKASMRLDDWVLCRLREKGNTSRNSPGNIQVGYSPLIEELPSTHACTNTNIIRDYGYQGCQVFESLFPGQSFAQIENVSSGIFHDNDSGLLHKDRSDKGNSPVPDTYFDTIFNALKGKTNEENIYDNILLPTKTMANNKDNKDNLPANMLNDNGMNFYIQNQSQGDIFNSNPLNAISSLQRLNEPSFMG